jgi:hypothetical protein
LCGLKLLKEKCVEERRINIRQQHEYENWGDVIWVGGVGIGRDEGVRQR